MEDCVTALYCDSWLLFIFTPVNYGPGTLQLSRQFILILAPSLLHTAVHSQGTPTGLKEEINREIHRFISLSS